MEEKSWDRKVVETDGMTRYYIMDVCVYLEANLEEGLHGDDSVVVQIELLHLLTRLNFMEIENGNRNYIRVSCVGHKSLGGVKHRLSYNIIKTVHERRDGRRRTLLVKKWY
jgi:hypothetical protein